MTENSPTVLTRAKTENRIFAPAGRCGIMAGEHGDEHGEPVAGASPKARDERVGCYGVMPTGRRVAAIVLRLAAPVTQPRYICELLYPPGDTA